MDGKLTIKNTSTTFQKRQKLLTATFSGRLMGGLPSFNQKQSVAKNFI
jgi:hypothetical protein